MGQLDAAQDDIVVELIVLRVIVARIDGRGIGEHVHQLVIIVEHRLHHHGGPEGDGIPSIAHHALAEVDLLQRAGPAALLGVGDLHRVSKANGIFVQHQRIQAGDLEAGLEIRLRHAIQGDLLRLPIDGIVEGRAALIQRIHQRRHGPRGIGSLIVEAHPVHVILGLHLGLGVLHIEHRTKGIGGSTGQIRSRRRHR